MAVSGCGAAAAGAAAASADSSPLPRIFFTAGGGLVGGAAVGSPDTTK